MMTPQSTAEMVCLNIGAPDRDRAYVIGFAISDTIVDYIIKGGLTIEDLKRHQFCGLILKQVLEIHAIGVAEGRAIERSDNVCRALFGIG